MYSTGGIFATFPKPFLSVFGGIFDSIIGTGMLLFGIFALND